MERSPDRDWGVVTETKHLRLRFHILSYLKRLRVFVRSGYAAVRTMRFPTFDPRVSRSLASLGDYFRFATIGLALQRVLQDKVEGSLAEVGVYRGELSKFIQELAPQRTLYLFDTFEGFPV